MRLEERRVGKWVLVAGLTAGLIPVVYLSSIFVYGTWVAGPRPVPETRPASALLRDALWARTDGGAATALRPVNPVTVVQHVACTELADWYDDPQARRRECRNYLPALAGIEYLSTMLLKDRQIERASFRGGAGAMATTVWLTQSWTRENFLDTLAARADFGNGWRGIEAAAQGYYGRAAGELTLSQAALIASRIANLEIDPWCHPQGATTRRNTVLQRMRENNAIDEPSLQDALGRPLELAPPTEGRPPCKE